MRNTLTVEQIDAIWRSLTLPQRSVRSRHSLIDKAVSEGCLDLTSTQDLLNDLDYRLDRFRLGVSVEEWCGAFDIMLHWIYERPKKPGRSAVGWKNLGASELAELLICLERLGYAIDPTPLAKPLLPAIAAKERITDSELEVFGFEACRHKRAPLTVEAAEFPGIRKLAKLRTQSGYKLEAWLDAEGKAFHLASRAPKYRKPREQVFAKCPICGFEWLRGDPDSAERHRAEHKARLRYLQPQIVRRYAESRDPGRGKVNCLSPKWKHREMYGRAKAFQREMGYDFAQWNSPDTNPDDDAIGILFDHDDLIVGACSFRLRGNTWCMDWIWIAPPYRRSGILTRYWPELRKRFGDFPLESPVSEAMKAFVRKIGDGHLLELRG